VGGFRKKCATKQKAGAPRKKVETGFLQKRRETN
jgi:hypothetical protein